jgi:hypothetical protein
MFEFLGKMVTGAAGMLSQSYNKKKRKPEDGGDPDAVSLPRAMRDVTANKKKKKRMADEAAE